MELYGERSKGFPGLASLQPGWEGGDGVWRCVVGCVCVFAPQCSVRKGLTLHWIVLTQWGRVMSLTQHVRLCFLPNSWVEMAALLCYCNAKSEHNPNSTWVKLLI